MTQQPSIWHADEAELRALADGVAGPVLGASVESHLMRCGACRARMNDLVDGNLLDAVWTGIRETVEAPRSSVVERILRRLGVSAESGRLLVAVPAMRGAWLLGATSALLFAGVAALFASSFGLGLFLLVAPLVPVMGVAAAYGGDADPSHELVVTTPYSAGRLLLLRTSAVLGTSLPIAALVGLALPGPAWLALAWLGPGLAFVALSLAAAPFVGTTFSSAAVAATWSAVVITVARVGDPMDLVGPAVQVGSLVLCAAAVTIILTQYRLFDLPRGQS
jgi:hypothetical protein